ncbi:GMC family oxidoreductase [Marinobacter sp. ATCH36]|uniref:GMC oxidoreductase n=1 Tax=Marinobacter sp. ATCH36 TaxID=2945106 RepID=UPI0020224257|nr:GMC family oxidoreductase [Marinobacter sp. ATCH36]MCL7945439.1 GMC family oxidoreductase [Marinobacter sp. ATCH36]
MILNQPKYRHYDIIIVGSGPAGITTALELSKDPSLEIAVIESGSLEPLPTIQTLASVQLHGDLNDNYFPMHTQRCFGGTSTIWGGFCAVLEERAFAAQEWPISYQEIGRWYPAAARILELPDAAYRLPTVAIEGTSELVYKPFYLSPPVRFNKKYHSFFQYHPRVDLILGNTAVRLITRGHTVTALELRDSLAPRLSSTFVSAETFVLACGGVGNPRLLQLSDIVEQMPVGLGLMEHPHIYAVADIYLDRDRLPSGIKKDPRIVNALQLSDSYCIENGVLSFSADFNLEQMTRTVLLGERRGMLHTPVSIRAEIAPDFRNSVGDSDQRNYLGIPMPRVDFHYRYHDLARQSWRLFGEALLRSGLGRPSVLQPEFRVHDGGHLMGTTRMGLSAADSVVDSNCRVHTTDNLYVAGSSVFPAGGASNPTYTIVAMALRLGAHLAGTLKGNAHG